MKKVILLIKGALRPICSVASIPPDTPILPESFSRAHIPPWRSALRQGGHVGSNDHFRAFKF
jgi:hypothetical protein